MDSADGDSQADVPPGLWREDDDDHHEDHDGGVGEDERLNRIFDNLRQAEPDLPLLDPVQPLAPEAAASGLQCLAVALAQRNSSMRLADAMRAADVASASWAKVIAIVRRPCSCWGWVV